MAEFYKQFWTWTDYSDYLMFTCLFTISVGALTYFCIKVHWYIETLGFLAVFIEAIQGLPQFARNLSNRSTEGMKYDPAGCLSCTRGWLARSHMAPNRPRPWPPPAPHRRACAVCSPSELPPPHTHPHTHTPCTAVPK